MLKRVITGAMLLVSSLSWAQAPLLLGYQGRLLKTDGTPETGNVQMRFAFFSGDTGGTSLWDETQAVALTQGFYSTYLGRATAFPATVFDSSAVWLEVAVQAAGDTQFRSMTPRQRVGSVAYAISARNVKGGTVDATSVSVNGSPVIDANGKLTSSAGYTAGPGISIDGTTRAIAVNSSGCTTGQVLQWNGSNWQCATVSGGSGGLSGVSGTAPIVVTNGTTAPVISLTAGTSPGQVMSWNGSAWAAAAPTPMPTVTATAPLTANTTSGGYVLGVTTGTTANTVAAGNDSRFGNALTVQGSPVAAVSPSANQVLQFVSGTWTPTTLPSSGGGNASNVIAQYEFEDVGSPLTDTSGSGANATFISGLTAGAVGHSGTGVNFSGGVATVAAGNSIPNSAQVFVEAWIWPQTQSATTSGVIAEKSGAWSLRYVTTATTSDLEFRIVGRTSSPNCTVVTSNAGISTSTWTHVAGYYDGLTIAILINGGVGAMASCSKGALAANAGTALTMGGPSGAGERYLGYLDALRVRSFAQVPVRKGIINITTRVNNTRAALSVGNSLTMESFVVDKKSPTSYLLIDGAVAGYGNYSGSMQQGWRLGSGTEVLGQALMYEANVHSKLFPTKVIISGHATTGPQTLVFRFFAANASGGERPFNVYNPNGADDARLGQTQSVYTVTEIEP
jgi:hypothetical protein